MENTSWKARLWGMVLLFALSITVVEAQVKTQVIAHRGYWKTEGSAQNSLASIRKAAEAGVYGSEFDVHLTADGKLVVFHDDEVNGLKIQDSNFSDLSAVTLANGEKIPTLEQYLDEAKKWKDIELIFELKSHATPEREDEAVRRSVEMIEQQGLASRTTYIAFSLHAAEAFHRCASDAEVYYLNGDLTPEELKSRGLSGLDYHFKAIQEHPDWVKEAHELGLKVNVWTVNDRAVMQEMKNLGVDYLTTDLPEEALEVIAE